jgi:GNAT superfamily N-acetyltransferase
VPLRLVCFVQDAREFKGSELASSMYTSIRPASLEADRSLLTELLSRNLNPDAGGARFDWLYLRNPHGFARVWIAVDLVCDGIVGAAAAFPRKLCKAGSSCLGQVLGDFCVDPQYRSLGLALQLQRACLEQVSSPCSVLSYDFPSDRMMAIYRRMRLAPMGQMVRWSKPLQAERKMCELVRSPALARGLAAPINKLLVWRDKRSASNHEWLIEEHRGACGDEFTRLARSIGSRYGTCIERSADYLNWRFLGHPLARYQFLTARRGKELLGYLIFSQTADDAKIVDLFGIDNAAMWTALLAHAVSLLRSLGTIAVSMPALASNPWVGLLKGLGFRPRESCPVVSYTSGKDTTPDAEASSWFLTDGDRES